jgi:transposase
MTQIIRIGLDLAKNVFEVHGVDAGEQVVLRRSLRRYKVLAFFAKLPPCLVGMEACATAHYWGRELRQLGHEVRLIPPHYAKAYVRRHSNDPADAAAICEAVGRPSMRFVDIKTEAQQAAASLHKVREMLVKQRTMWTNHLRGMLAEFGIVVAKGPHHVTGLLDLLVACRDERLPELAREALQPAAEMLRSLEQKVAVLDKKIAAWGRSNKTCRHLITAPGYGPVLASAMAAIVTNPAAFTSGRHFAASLGITPRLEGTGGKVHPGKISKRGNGYLRRLLVNGAMSVLNSRHARQDPWIAGLLASKPRKLAAVALANKMARIGWALMMRQEDYRARPAAGVAP